MNGMLFATYGFLMKLQLQVHDDHARDHQQQQQPTLGQIFLAGAGCGLASTYYTPLPYLKKEND